MKVIAFDGVDGSGKSTCIEILQKYYEDQGKKVVIIKGRPIINTKFDDVEFPVINDQVLFFLHLARLQAMEQKIFNLKKEKVDVVLLDRFFDSAFVYSKLLNIRKLKRKAFTRIIYKYYHLSFRPDLTIYCTAPLKLVYDRLKEKKEKFKAYEIKFANKLFIERAQPEENTNKLLVVCIDVKTIEETIIKKVKELDNGGN